ncbi:hypothetical protein ANCCEY_14530 [Ancylostoma ceylanicum]|uniref:Uncharacterized protein n=1 Tax=Ancylostoma ceylanicum TaxID=53326 RepID=A0A0D6L4Z3_9BILA|nr:hypothetical protein ANCCEY_14530 [Ancylostoma ceylanicum]
MRHSHSQWASPTSGSPTHASSAQDLVPAASAPTITVLSASMVSICAEGASESTPRISDSRSLTDRREELFGAHMLLFSLVY